MNKHFCITNFVYKISWFMVHLDGCERFILGKVLTVFFLSIFDTQHLSCIHELTVIFTKLYIKQIQINSFANNAFFSFNQHLMKISKIFTLNNFMVAWYNGKSPKFKFC